MKVILPPLWRLGSCSPKGNTDHWKGNGDGDGDGGSDGNSDGHVDGDTDEEEEEEGDDDEPYAQPLIVAKFSRRL